MKTLLHHKFILIKLLVILSVLLFSNQKIIAQCPQNIGFDAGNFSGWQCFTSDPTGTPIGCCPIAANTLSGPVANRHDITSGNGVDPYSGLPVVCPYPGYGAHSIKLGNNSTGSESERVRTNFTVTPGNASLIYRFAAVMEDPNHAVTDQPRLEFKAIDQVGNLIVCASVNQPTPPSTAFPQGWFASPNNSSISCSNWIPVSVNLSNYVGQTITIEFATGDCALGGHFGYAYIDLTCGNFSVLNGYCPGSTHATLYAPQGFSNYVWDTVGTGLPYIQNGPYDSLVIFAPDTATIYSVILTPAGALGCVDTLIDTLRIQPSPTANFGFAPTACAGSFTNFYDSSVTHIWGSNIVTWDWDFGDPASGVVNNHSTLQNPLHVFSNPGTYNVSLIVTSDLSCVSDTVFKSITVIPPPPVNPNAGLDKAFCKYDSTQLLGTGNATYGPFAYSWSPAVGLSNDSIANPWAHPLVTTTYTLILTDPIGCNFFDSVKVVIKGVVPIFAVTGDDTICPGVSDQLGFTDIGPDPIPNTVAYNWIPNTSLNGTNIPTPISTPVSTITYSLTIDDNGCQATKFFTINIDNRNSVLASMDTLYCIGGSAHLNAVASGPAASGGFIYNWSPAVGLSNNAIANPIATPPSTTTYLVSTSGYGGCIVTDDVVVHVVFPYQLDLADSANPCLNKPYAIQFNSLIPNVNSYQWNININDGSITCYSCTATTVTVNKATWLYVNTSNDAGCIVGDSIWISPIACPDIFVPTAFSPNNDGRNDYFFLLDNRFAKLNYFEIYNRWGQLVYSTTDLYAKGWDGKYNNEMQEIGAYIYKIQAVDRVGEVKSKTGNVTLLR